MRLRRSPGLRLDRTVLLGTACLLYGLGPASAQNPASNAVSCLTGLACNASGTNIAQLQPIVDKVVGRALLNMQPVNGNAPALGAIVGVSWKGQRAYFGYGRNAPAYQPDTIVELGSITKVFTTALLAEAVTERNVNLDEKVSTYRSAIGLPGLTWCGAQATLKELANFSSGMPDEPDNLPSRNAIDNGVRNYTVDDFKNWVSRWVPTGATSTQCPLPDSYVYSNASIGLLGYVVAYQFGKPWIGVVRDKILGPLGMSSTFAPAMDGSVPPGLSSRIAVGRGKDYSPVAPWPYFAWYAAGVLRSDASDVLSFGEAGLGNSEIDGSAPSPQVQRAVKALAAAITAGRTTTYPVNNSDGQLAFRQGLAWQQIPAQPSAGLGPLWNKNGGTDGFKTVLTLDPGKDLAVFIAAGQNQIDVTQLGTQLARQIR